MSRVQIPINGISTSSSYKDGDVLSISNLRKKNGALKPVTPRLVTKTLQKKYDYIFVHDLPSGASNNYIGVRDDEVFYIENPGNAETESETSLCEVSGFISITQMGNVINILDENGLQHIIWYDNEYKLINTDFDGEQTDTELFCKVDLKVEREEVSYLGTNNLPVFRQVNGTDIEYTGSSDFNLTDKLDLRKEEFKSLATKVTGLLRQDGYPVHFFVACTAIELYDGTYVFHSNPVLLGQANDVKTRYEGLDINSHICNYNNSRAVFRVEGTTITTKSEYVDKRTISSESPSYTHAIKSATYIENAIYPSVLGYLTYGDPADTVTRNVGVIAYKNKLQFKVSKALIEKYRTIIKSISVFITSEINPWDEETVISTQETYSDPLNDVLVENYVFTPKQNIDITKELSNNHIFYKVHEIEFDDLLNTSDWISIDLEGKLGDNLVSQEVLPVDNFTHHKLIPNKQYIYNSRLHAMDYKTVLSHGFPLNYFHSISGSGQFEGSTSAFENQFYIKTTIKTDTGLTNVVRYGTLETLSDLNAMLSYPDSRATKIEIGNYYDNGFGVFSKAIQTFALKASESHNFAYYINPELKPIALTFATETGFTVPPEINRELIYRNGMKASALNNPFTFPSIQTYQIGTGIIRGAASNAMRISEGQFGQYPLYVFTTDRIYAMNVGTGEVLYTTQSAVSNETPVSNIFCSTPYGVVFLGKRGLFIINGQKVDFISPQLEQYPVELNIDYLDTGITEASPFSELTINNILYDAQNNEIIIVNQGNNLVYNLDSKEFYTTTEVIQGVVENVYPELYVMVDNDDEVTEIKDFSQESESTQQIYFSTRPFNFGTPDKKRLERMILRARLHDAAGLKAVVFASQDGINFSAIHGKYLPDGNRRDIDMLHPAKKNYFMFAFIGTLDKESEITMIEAEVNQDTNSSKMR